MPRTSITVAIPIVKTRPISFFLRKDEKKCQVKAVSNASLTDHVFNAPNTEETQKKCETSCTVAEQRPDRLSLAFNHQFLGELGRQPEQN